MKKIINKILTIFLIMILSLCTIKISKAATYNFNLTGNSQANKGDTITFTITANGLTGNVKLSGSNVSLSNSQIWVEKNTVTFTATVTGFPASVTATPVELTDNEYNIVSIDAITRTITEIEKEKPPVTTNPEPNVGGQTNNQGQTNQGNSQSPQTNQGSAQSPQTNQGTTSNPQINQGGTTNQGSTTNSQRPSTGQTTSSNQGTNNQAVTSDGQIKSSNNYLKDLEVSVGTLTPEFYRETFEYTIDNIIENEIEITAEAEDEKAIINGIGTIALSGGENIINIEVIAENEQARTYTIVVNKIEKTKESNLRLESLEIQAINEENEFEDLDIGFNKDTLDYRVTVDDNITDLSVLATVDREGIIIQTEGEKNLKEGENIVTITLSNQNGTENNLYGTENNQSDNLNDGENNQSENNLNDEGTNSNEINNEIKEETVYTIKVTRKAKPIVEISNSVYEMQRKKIIAGVILAVIVITLVTIIIINIKKNKNRKKKKLKK